MPQTLRRPGPPPGPPERVKTARVPVQMTPADYATLAAAAARAGCSMAELLRADARAAGHLPPEGAPNGAAN
jgi:hypothetical protein